MERKKEKTNLKFRCKIVGILFFHLNFTAIFFHLFSLSHDLSLKIIMTMCVFFPHYFCSTRIWKYRIEWQKMICIKFLIYTTLFFPLGKKYLLFLQKSSTFRSFLFSWQNINHFERLKRCSFFHFYYREWYMSVMSVIFINVQKILSLFSRNSYINLMNNLMNKIFISVLFHFSRFAVNHHSNRMKSNSILIQNFSPWINICEEKKTKITMTNLLKFLLLLLF